MPRHESFDHPPAFQARSDGTAQRLLVDRHVLMLWAETVRRRQAQRLERMMSPQSLRR